MEEAKVAIKNFIQDMETFFSSNSYFFQKRKAGDNFKKFIEEIRLYECNLEELSLMKCKKLPK